MQVSAVLLCSFTTYIERYVHVEWFMLQVNNIFFSQNLKMIFVVPCVYLAISYTVISSLVLIFLYFSLHMYTLYTRLYPSLHLFNELLYLTHTHTHIHTHTNLYLGLGKAINKWWVIKSWLCYANFFVRVGMCPAKFTFIPINGE